jgi:hypothetical protein
MLGAGRDSDAEAPQRPQHSRASSPADVLRPDFLDLAALTDAAGGPARPP